MSFSLIYICCSFPGGILSVLFPAVAIRFWPAGNLECPRLFSDLILFPFLLLFFYIVPYPSFTSMSFSLIYICCSFRGGILFVVFPTVAICFWPAENLECPCLFSDLILFPFHLLFFYIVPYPSFSSMSFSWIYICCSFRGGILSVVFPAVAICFWPAGNLECLCLFSDLILFPFLLLFLYIVPYPSCSSMSFSRERLRRVLRKKAAVILHLHTFTSADLDLHTFTPADLDLHTFTPADLDLHTFTSADLDLHTLTSADLDLHTFTSADLDLHTLTPADLDLHTLTPADLDLHTLTSADLDLHTFTPADLDLHTLTPADLHLHTLTSADLHLHPSRLQI